MKTISIYEEASRKAWAESAYFPEKLEQSFKNLRRNYFAVLRKLYSPIPIASIGSKEVNGKRKLVINYTIAKPVLP